MLHPCSKPNCPNLVPMTASRCPAHAAVPWHSNNPRRHQRTNGWAWSRTRQRILDRDVHRCGCGAPASQVDHVLSIGQGGSDDDSNLRAICLHCHAKKTATEAALALQKDRDSFSRM